MQLEDILSTDNFTTSNLAKAHREKVLRDNATTSLYFSYQIQSDLSNVCGEYSLFFYITYVVVDFQSKKDMSFGIITVSFYTIIIIN